MINWVMPSLLAFSIVLAGVLHLLAARTRHEPPLAPTLAPQARAPAPPEATVLKVVEPRIFVGADITPQFLVNLFQDHTEMQAGKVLDVYVGKWMKLSGAVSDVAKVSAELSMVIFSGRASLGEPSIFMLFGKKWLGQLSILRRGNNIAVEGRIRNVDWTGLHLDDCDLV